MNKDDYAKHIARKSIVEKFIDKLDKVSMEDTELLPALIRFVENGDEREFKEFRDYHFNVKADEKRRMVEESKRELDLLNKRADAVYEEYRKKKAEYEEWRNAYIEKLKELPNPMGETKPYVTLGNLHRFCDVNGIKDTKYIYVMDENGNQYKVVGYVVDDKGKLVLKFNIGNDRHETPEPPFIVDPHFDF